MSNNSIFCIRPYKDNDVWMFDDPSVGLVREPFVAGIDTMLDTLCSGIPDFESGVSLLFSSAPFPDYTVMLERIEEDCGGNWYRCDELDMNGWLCPALFQYYETAPDKLYVKIRSK